jgi:hypothetical protein
MSLFVVVVVSCSCVFLWLKLMSKKTPRLPPGPPSIPLLGHMFSFPRNHQEIAFHELGKLYGMFLCKMKTMIDVHPVEGDVIHLRAMGKSFVVLNSVKAATDLLDKRSNNYSERPDFPVFELFEFTFCM